MGRALSFLCIVITAHSSAQVLHDQIKLIYNFSPRQLTRDEQRNRTLILDEFWTKIKSDTTRYLHELRTELRRDDHPPFFYFDGGQLLLAVSGSRADKQLALDGILKSDFNDIDRRSVVVTLNNLAKANLDTTPAALKILDDREFKFFLPGHSFFYTKGYCLAYTLLPVNPERYIEIITNRLKDEPDINNQKSMITLLWFAHTCKGNELLRALSDDKDIHSETAKYVKFLLARKFRKERYYKELNNLSPDGLLRAQVAATDSISDEAIDELDYITRKLRQTACR